MDFKDLEEKIDGDTKMLLLCNPHNSGGRAWTRKELQKLDKICTHKSKVLLDLSFIIFMYKNRINQKD